jgi:hypothetical protein
MDPNIKWLPITNQPGYWVTDYGYVCSRKRVKPIILKPCNHRSGFYRVWLCRREVKYVHRLVGEYFIPNPNGFKYLKHKDGDRTNNKASNLIWCKYSRYNSPKKATYVRISNDNLVLDFD